VGAQPTKYGRAAHRLRQKDGRIGANFYVAFDMIRRTGSGGAAAGLPKLADRSRERLRRPSSTSSSWRRSSGKDETLGSQFGHRRDSGRYFGREGPPKISLQAGRGLEVAAERPSALSLSRTARMGQCRRTLKRWHRTGPVTSKFVPGTCGLGISKKRACSRASNAVGGLSPGAGRDVAGHQTASSRQYEPVGPPQLPTTRPFSGIAFKIMTDPFVGS